MCHLKSGIIFIHTYMSTYTEMYIQAKLKMHVQNSWGKGNTRTVCKSEFHVVGIIFYVKFFYIVQYKWQSSQQWQCISSSIYLYSKTPELLLLSTSSFTSSNVEKFNKECNCYNMKFWVGHCGSVSLTPSFWCTALPIGLYLTMYRI